MKNDLQIQQDVQMELRWQPILLAASIGVAVKDGIVTLSGMVNTYAQKNAAEKAARKVAGVKAIAEDIQIGVSPVFNKTDMEIAASVLHALKSHSSVPEDSIKIKVENGVVTLEGQVQWDYQRSAAKNSISSLVGVRDVFNFIEVKPTANITNVKAKISEALQRAATIDSGNIQVEVIGTKVRLNGTIRSYAEKDDAENAAWCAPGITEVENHLKVSPTKVLTF